MGRLKTLTAILLRREDPQLNADQTRESIQQAGKLLDIGAELQRLGHVPLNRYTRAPVEWIRAILDGWEDSAKGDKHA